MARTPLARYDLDIFNIVAVSDFNMGAMENKSLNVFNTSAVLATPEVSTDDQLERVAGIVAHEYFHNYTGQRAISEPSTAPIPPDPLSLLLSRESRDLPRLVSADAEGGKAAPIRDLRVELIP